jgi:hypothetical protein
MTNKRVVSLIYGYKSTPLASLKAHVIFCSGVRLVARTARPKLYSMVTTEYNCRENRVSA